MTKAYHAIKVYRTPRSGFDAWTVTWYEGGKRKRKLFGKEDDAEEFAEDKSKKIARGEVASLDFGPKDAASWGRAVDLVKDTGKSLELVASEYAEIVRILGDVPPIEAARDYRRRHPVSLKKKSIAEIVAELVESKSKDGLSDRHVDDLESRLGRFAKEFTCPLLSITTASLEEWLRGISKGDGELVSPRTRNNYRNAMANLFNFAKARHYLPRDWNEIDHVSRQKRPETDVEIFTPDEMRWLLTCAAESVIPVLAIGGFAGLRTSEIQRLDWKHVRFDSGFITVPAKTKTGRRIVPLLPNLRSWLETRAKKEGPVCLLGNTTNGFERTVEKVNEKRSEKMRWKHNGLRHSFASYRLAATQNAPQVALEDGHSVRVLMTCYRELVTPTESDKWFSIRP